MRFHNPFVQPPNLPKAKRHGPPVLIIRRNDRGAGIFAHFAVNVGLMRLAIDHGIVPYVDMRFADNAFTRGLPIPFNPWECFFDQVPGCDLDGLLRAKAVHLVSEELKSFRWPKCDPNFAKEGSPELLDWRQFVHEHLHVNRDMAAFAEERRKTLFGAEDNVLGCLIRGTDYTRMKPKWHPVQPDPETVIRDAKAICAERKLNRVFLATEDAAVVELFRRAFGDSLILNQTELPKYKSGYLMSSGAISDGEQVMRISRQYMTSILLLARCRCLLAGCASGTIGAMLLSDGYEWSRVYDLGTYP